MNAWPETTLQGKIHIKHGFAFKGEYFAPEGKYVVLTPGNFHESGGFRIREGKEKFYAGEIPHDYILKRSDLIVAMTEQGEGLLGSAAIIPASDAYLHNQRLGLITEDKSEIDKTFLYYLFNTNLVRKQIRNSSSGTKVRHTSPERIYRVKVRLPKVETQRKIAAILSAYDELIENNRRRIALLERMAEEIYREWFLRFRFPGYQNATFEKGIPQGWTLGKIDSLGRVVTGKTPSTKNSKYYGGGIPFVKTPDMHGNMFVYDTEEKLTEEGLSSQPSQIIPANAISVSCIGTGGIVSITTKKCSTNQQINSVVLKNVKDLEWGYYTLQSLKETIKAFGATGATMTNLSKGKFAGMKVILPPEQLRDVFHEKTFPIFEQIKALMLINMNLEKTKTMLLPRLISGKLSVEGLEIRVPPGMENDRD